MTDKSNKLIEIAKANGAMVFYTSFEPPILNKITFNAVAQLQATIDAVTVERIAELEALSVTNIMIDVVAGDGSGYEVYAKSVADVENLLSKMGLKLEEYELAKPLLSTGDYIKRSDVLKLFDQWLLNDDTIEKFLTALNSLPSAKPDNAHPIEEVSDALPEDKTA